MTGFESTGPTTGPPSTGPTRPWAYPYDPTEYPPESTAPIDPATSTALYERTTPRRTGRSFHYYPAWFWAALAFEESHTAILCDPDIPWQIWDAGLKAAMQAVAQAAHSMGDEHAQHMVQVRYDPESRMAIVRLECECGETRIMPITGP